MLILYVYFLFVQLCHAISYKNNSCKTWYKYKNEFYLFLSSFFSLLLHFYHKGYLTSLLSISVCPFGPYKNSSWLSIIDF